MYFGNNSRFSDLKTGPIIVPGLHFQSRFKPCVQNQMNRSFVTKSETSMTSAEPSLLFESTTPDFFVVPGLNLRGVKSHSKTLYISNIPSRIMEEDVHNLFVLVKGFQTARMRRTKLGRYIAFVEFETPDDAVRAKDAFTGYNFDTRTITPQGGIHIEFSHKDSSVALSLPTSPRDTSEMTSSITSSMTPTSFLGSPCAQIFSANLSASSSASPLPLDQDEDVDEYLFGEKGDCFYDLKNNNNNYPNYLPYNANETLYIEGVPVDAKKREVAHIFRFYPGYKDLRLFLKLDKFTGKEYYLCFVDFDTPEHAFEALSKLQGYKFDPDMPEQRGLTIYFAKTKQTI